MTTISDRTGLLLGGLRIGLAWIWLWPFMDKLLGLGFATAKEDAWIRGGSPTHGFLHFGAADSPFADTFAAISGPFVDGLFMLGLLGIGIAFGLGIGMRIAAWSGTLLLFLMWLALLPLEHNPFLDDHILYGAFMIALERLGAGRWLGLAEWWSARPLVRKYPFLK